LKSGVSKCDTDNRAAPPQPSKRELEIAEAQTLTDIKWTAASAVVLYFCEWLHAKDRLGNRGMES
jgi:hypothetical protein